MSTRQALDLGVAMFNTNYPPTRNYPEAVESTLKYQTNRAATVVDGILNFPPQSPLVLDSWFSNDGLLLPPALTKLPTRVFNSQLTRGIISNFGRQAKRLRAASGALVTNSRLTCSIINVPIGSRQRKSLDHPDPLACHLVAGSLSQAPDTTRIKPTVKALDISSSNDLTASHDWKVSLDQTPRQAAYLAEKMEASEIKSEQAYQNSEDLTAQLNLMRTQLANAKAITRHWEWAYNNLKGSQVSTPPNVP